MSFWTYITGVITVSPMGKTQPQKRYVLDTVLAHLPRVTGSEHNMRIHVIQRSGHDGSSSHNEFDEPVIRDADSDGWMRTQSKYFILVDASLRDRMFEDTFCEFNQWLNRLSKRVDIDDILVRIDGYSEKNYMPKSYTYDDAEPYMHMFEGPSWFDGREPAWAEYLLWDCAKGARYPMKLAYKYYADPENDAEVERRIEYERE